jgi:4-amino-4-deoxychorismate lyase
MCQLFETIKVKDNQLQNPEYHDERVCQSRLALFGARDKWNLSRLIQVPQLDMHQIYRCRFIYAREVEGIEFIPYIPRTLERLYLIKTPEMQYSFKYTDRSKLDGLKHNLANKPGADILIVINNNITDTSFSNIIFFDGREWLTPDTPLLKGTKRARYLKEGMIKEVRISVDDLSSFKKARLINAMLDFDTGYDIDIRNIIAV